MKSLAWMMTSMPKRSKMIQTSISAIFCLIWEIKIWMNAMERKNLRSNSSPRETRSSTSCGAPPKTLSLLPLFQEKIPKSSSNFSSR